MFGLLKKTVNANINKVNGRLDVLQACAAAGALVAAGDGDASEAEEAITIKTIKANEMMSSFSPKQVEDIVSRSFDKAETGRSGRLALFKEIKDVADDREIGEIVLILALDVAEANGGIEDGEKAILDKVAAELGLKLADYI